MAGIEKVNTFKKMSLAKVYQADRLYENGI